MSDTVYKKDHFNLYYIFKEDKEQNILSKETAEGLYKRILLKVIIENKKF